MTDRFRVKDEVEMTDFVRVKGEVDMTDRFRVKDEVEMTEHVRMKSILHQVRCRGDLTRRVICRMEESFQSLEQEAGWNCRLHC